MKKEEFPTIYKKLSEGLGIEAFGQQYIFFAF